MPRRVQIGYGRSHLKGVAWDERRKKWRAQIQLSLGYFDSEEEAGQAYVDAEAEFRQPALKFRREHERPEPVVQRGPA